MNNAIDVWNMALPILNEKLHPTAISAWFNDAVPVSFDGDTLVLTTPNKVKKDFLETKFLHIIKEIFSDLFFSEIEIIFKVEGEKVLEEVPQDFAFEDDYTFEQFIVGSSNKFAHAAAMAVANNPAKSYNPLFIYGPSGLGKTHLLNSISSVIKKTKDNPSIIYIKGEDFTNELVSAIGSAEVGSFRDKYRQADLLLVDDIQFIAGKERTQEEFFHTFNALHESNKQIVLTSDRPPKEINTLEDRLKTRFEWGLLADIAPPDYETRLAIIEVKTKKLGFSIPSEVADFVATSINSNVRQLEGTIKKIGALHSLMGRTIDQELASKAIDEVFLESPGLNPKPKLIVDEVSKYYNVSADKVFSSSRSKDIMQARQVSMYLVRSLTNYSLPEIGREFNRDHTTVLHAINKIEVLLKNSSDMSQEIDNLIKNIRNE